MRRPYAPTTAASPKQKLARAIVLALTLGAGGATLAQEPAAMLPERTRPERGGGEEQPRLDRWRSAPRETPRAAVGFFYDELAPYGEWVFIRAYGWAWHPHDRPRNWRPYTVGRWALTASGWTWASEEPFGWATYHYGRWTRDSRHGWLWIPGSLWAPAWVVWQSGGGYIGWAPLPPSAGFDRQRGIGSGLFGLRPDAFTFVAERSFLAPQLAALLEPRSKSSAIFELTEDVTRYDWDGTGVVGQGVAVGPLEASLGRTIPLCAIVEVLDKGRSVVGERELRLYRPSTAELDTVTAGPRLDAGLGAEMAPPPDPDR